MINLTVLRSKLPLYAIQSKQRIAEGRVPDKRVARRSGPLCLLTFAGSGAGVFGIRAGTGMIGVPMDDAEFEQLVLDCFFAVVLGV